MAIAKAVKQGMVVQSNIDPWAVNNRIGTTDGRYALGALLSPKPGESMVDHVTGVMAAGEGINPAGQTHLGLICWSPDTGMEIRVEAGHCIINTTGQGPYMCALDQQVTLAIAPSDSAKPRLDCVIARVYDDENSAIGSAAGTRKMTVEVWTGEPADDASLDWSWKPPINDGYHILAHVYVPAGATKIMWNTVHDRRGPGITARGGVKVYEESLSGPERGEFREPGAFPGEQRWCMNPVTFPQQVYYGEKHVPDGRPQGWQGVNNCITYASSLKVGQGWRHGEGHREDLTWLDVAWPGVPYMLEISGRNQLFVSANVKLETQVCVSGLPNFGEINWNMQDTRHKGPDGPQGDSELGFQIAPVMAGPFNDVRRVYLVIKIWSTYGSATRGFAPTSNPYSHSLLVKQTPAANGQLRWT